MHRTAFDHAAPLARKELLAWGEELRDDAPIAWSESHGGMWVVSRYEDICAIARDNKTFISGKGITIPPLKSPIPVIPAESDAPNHVHYRSVLLGFLTPKEVRAHEDAIRRIITDALDPLVVAKGGDAINDFAARIPTRAMASVFGFQDADAYRFDEDFSEVVNAASSGDNDRQMKAVATFLAFLREKLDERRADPGGDDVVSAILRYDSKGKTFSEEECLGLLWSTAGGAVDTTKHAIGHAIYDLGTRPDVRKRLIDDPSLLPSAVEEVLRLDAPAHVGGRYVIEDTVYNGVEMKAGQRVLLMWGAGNRDPREFGCPHDMDPARKPNRHLSFGHGAHQCVGMHLAKTEIRIAIEEVLTRIPDYELVDPGLDPQMRGGLMWSFETLPIRIP